MGMMIVTQETVGQIEKALSAADPIVADLIRTFGPCTLYKTKNSTFEIIMSSIIGQQLSSRAATTIKARIKLGIKDLTPDNIKSKTLNDLRTFGLSKNKARCLLSLSDAILSKQIDLDALQAMANNEVIECLCQISGIGRWTAEMFLIFGLKKADVLSENDAGLRRAVFKLYGDDKTLLGVSQDWVPYRSVASWYLWKYLDS